MRKFLSTKDDCGEILFAYYQQLVARFYISAGPGKPMASSPLQVIASWLRAGLIPLAILGSYAPSHHRSQLQNNVVTKSKLSKTAAARVHDVFTH